jgi:hypothetical protein
MVPRAGWGSCAWAAALMLGCAAPAPVDRIVADERVVSLQARVAGLREHAFTEPVEARVVSQERANGLIAAEIARLGRDALEGQEHLAQALGLLPQDVALVPALLALYQVSVAGFYSGTSGHLYLVEGAEGAGGEDALLVHELTHAYQDRHSAIVTAMLGLRTDDDLAFALGAALVGDALWTEFAFEEEQGEAVMPSPNLVAHMFDIDAAMPPGTPRLLQAGFVSQYPRGYRLVSERVAREGAAGLEAVLRDPPLSSEEVLHPQRYLAGADRRAVPDLPEATASWPPEGCRSVASNAWGELGLRVFGLEAGLNELRVERAAEGWDGDRSWLLECTAAPAWGWLVQLDSAWDATELEDLFRAAAGGLGEGTGIESAGLRVLLSRGLTPEARAHLLHAYPVRRHKDLESWLEAHPEVRRRAHALRDAAP